MSELHSELREKWDRRYREVAGTLPQPARVLAENIHLLPEQGDALDLACGRGGNALLLARSGLVVQAWDLSPVAIGDLQEMAQTEALVMQAEVRDVILAPPPAASFDVIVVSYFLERSLAPVLCEALRPGGLLFYQTFVRDKVFQNTDSQNTDSQNKVSPSGPTNQKFLLAENELLELFSTLTLRIYREEGSLGNVTAGLRNEAMLVAQRLPV